MYRLEHKVALVTGASGGFGAAIAVACARAGAAVGLVARRTEALRALADQLTSEGHDAVVAAADVRDEAQVAHAVSATLDRFGPIDLLVNNAGMNVTERSIRDTSNPQWNELLQTNLSSAFLFTKAVLPSMLERGHGTIVNVASRAALYPDLAGGVGYAASKMGLDALTRVTNEEANPAGVRACLLCPGVGNTPLLDRRPVPPPEEARRRMLQPEDVADTVLFIASMPQHVNIDLLSLKPTRA